MPKTLLYREVENGGLVFALEDEAHRVARIHEAIDQSQTWAEFRSLMPRQAYSEIVKRIDDSGEPRPRGKDEFSGEQIYGWSDGDYPDWLQSEMSRVIPTDVLEKYGTLRDTAINGPYWDLPPEREREIVADLNARGFVVKKAATLGFR